MIIKTYETKRKTIPFTTKIETNNPEKRKDNIMGEHPSKSNIKITCENENEKVIENIKSLFDLNVSSEYEKK